MNSPSHILPGVQVQLSPNISLIIYGGLIAIGTTSNPIVFTNSGSSNFGAVLIDGNFRMCSFFPFIFLASVINNCIFQNGGSGANGMLVFQFSLVNLNMSVTLSNSIFMNSISACIESLTNFTANNITVDNCNIGVLLDVVEMEVDYLINPSTYYGLTYNYSYTVAITNSVVTNCNTGIAFYGPSIYPVASSISQCQFTGNHDILLTNVGKGYLQFVSSIFLLWLNCSPVTTQYSTTQEQ